MRAWCFARTKFMLSGGSGRTWTLLCDSEWSLQSFTGCALRSSFYLVPLEEWKINATRCCRVHMWPPHHSSCFFSATLAVQGSRQALPHVPSPCRARLASGRSSELGAVHGWRWKRSSPASHARPPPASADAGCSEVFVEMTYIKSDI